MKKILSAVLALVLIVCSLTVILPMETAQAAGWVFPLPTSNAPYYVTVLNKYSSGAEHSSYINQYVLGGSSAPKDIVVDIAASANTAVYAVDGGTVHINKYTSGSGNHIVLKHSDGSYSYYGHLAQLPSFSKGDTVTAGQQIGKVGKTGNSTGYHIHFEWSKHDPYCLFANAGYVKMHSNSGASAYPHVHNTDGASCNCSTAYAGSYKVKGTSGTLAISSGHGASSAAGNTQLGSIPEGATVTISKAQGYNGRGSSSGKYGHVTYNGVSGYCSMNYLEKVSSASCSCSTSYAGWYTQKSTNGLSISSGHGASNASGNTKLGEIPYNSIIYITKAQGYNGQGSSSGLYGHVNYIGVSGYCSMNLLEKVKSYTLTLNPNGGSVSTSSFKVWAGMPDNYDLSDYIPTRAGYIFKGWYTSSSGGTQVYNSNGMCTNEGSYWKNNTYVRGANATLYAQWTPDTVFASFIYLSSEYEVLYEGDTLYLTATVLPENTTNKSVEWVSSDESVVTVEAGMLTALKMGSAAIYASTTDGSDLTAICSISVKPELNSFEMTPENPVMALSGIGSQLKFTAEFDPEFLKDHMVWASGMPEVADVDENGVVTAYAPGEANIYCIMDYGDFFEMPVKVVEDMTLMTLPADLTEIGPEAFDNANAERVQISDGCLSIGSRAFADCHGLRYVVIPDSVASIADDAFEGCSDLIILCGEGSEAERFALKKGIYFSIVE